MGVTECSSGKYDGLARANDVLRGGSVLRHCVWPMAQPTSASLAWTNRRPIGTSIGLPTSPPCRASSARDPPTGQGTRS